LKKIADEDYYREKCGVDSKKIANLKENQNDGITK